MHPTAGEPLSDATEPGTGGIFLSYRREETEHAAGRLGDRIAQRFGPEKLFVDVDSIPPGVDFAEAIQAAVRSCDVLLAFVGPRWVELRDRAGRRRIDDPDDFVVLELREALDRGIPVIPVLVDGATMPAPAELPAHLRAFSRRHAVRLDAETFRQDAAWLLEQLARIVPPKAPDAAPVDEDEGAPAPARRGSPSRRPSVMSRRVFLRLAGGVAALGVTGAGAWAALRPDEAGGASPVWALRTGDEVYSSPAVHDGRLYVGSSDQHLYAVDAASGETIWRHRTAGAVTSSPAVADGIVVTGARDRQVHAIDLQTGQKKWTFPTRGDVDSSPAIAGGRVYVGSRDKKLYVLDLKTGKKLDEFQAGRGIEAAPAVGQGVVVVGDTSGAVYCLEPK